MEDNKSKSKTIIRVQKNRYNPYAMINKEFLSNSKLSWKAKGLLTYVLSKPDDWQIIIKDLICKSKDGRDSVYSGLKELEDEGYLSKEITREKGRITGIVYTIFETPLTENPYADKHVDFTHFLPLTEKPDTGKPYTENPTLLINEYTNNEYTNKSNHIDVKFDMIDEMLKYYSEKFNLPIDKILSTYDRCKDYYISGNIKNSFKAYFEKALSKTKEDYELSKFID